MGGVHRFNAGHGRESRREQYLDCAVNGRCFVATDAERARLVAGVVAGWADDCIFFVASGASQVYLLSLDGGEARALTHLSTGVDIVKWCARREAHGVHFSVYPDCADDACNSARDAENEKSKVKARVAEHLLRSALDALESKASAAICSSWQPMAAPLRAI